MRRRPRRAAAPLAVVCLALAAGACRSPGPRAVGTIAALAAPTAWLVSAGILATLLAVWRNVAPALRRPARRGWVIGLAVHVLLGVLVLPFGVTRMALQWFAPGAYVIAMSHAAVALVVWRVWFAFQPSRSFVAAPLVASLLLLPAWPMAAGVLRLDEDVVGWLWVLPGCGGLVTVTLWTAALVEVWLRRSRPGRAARGPE